MEMQLNKILSAFLILLMISCKGNSQDEDRIEIVELKKASEKQIDFFNKKYIDQYGYELVIDESNVNDHPFFRYLDCLNEGYFCIHFVPKESDLRFFWEKEYYKDTDFNTYDSERDGKRIGEIINSNLTKYNVFCYYFKKEHLNNKDGCTLESIFLNENSIAELYLYNHETKKWSLIKTEKSDILPPYINNEFFTSNFPKLFSSDTKLNFNDDKSTNEIENSALLKNFVLKFSTSKIKNKYGDQIQKTRISLKNKETNKVQEVDFVLQSLITQFDGSLLNSISYFDTTKSIIRSYQEIEGGIMLIALDVNFDGLEDFAIVKDQWSNGGSQYAYYVQNSNKQFALETYLTETVRFFPYEIDKNKKTLTIIHPSGCCQIQTYKFQIQANGEWKDIYSDLEDMK